MPATSRLRIRLVASVLIALGTAGLLACSGSDDPEVILADVVAVTLTDTTITLDDETTPDGMVQLDVTNAGTESHDLLVVLRPSASVALPTLPDGTYDENAGGTSVVEVVEDVAPGATVQVTLELAPGSYVLLCNEVSGGTSHYASGMFAFLNVS